MSRDGLNLLLWLSEVSDLQPVVVEAVMCKYFLFWTKYPRMTHHSEGDCWRTNRN
jgi:hypothetical protein